MTQSNPIVVVSGLPRSGTSLMMRMLRAGGMPVVTDNGRMSDSDNPKGYFELEAVKQMSRGTEWLADAAGKALKVVSKLLQDLPDTCTYRIIFMCRDYREVIASQNKMLRNRGTSGAGVPDEKLMEIYEKHVARVLQACRGRADMELHTVPYGELVTAPEQPIRQIAEFLAPIRKLDTEAMRTVIDPTLYRNRVGS